MASLFFHTFRLCNISFVINLIREIVKDLEDINGDTSQGKPAIVLGILKTTKLVLHWGLSIITLLFTLKPT
jgi:4-hydroxybenzoate polyprenyltransferase